MASTTVIKKGSHPVLGRRIPTVTIAYATDPKVGETDIKQFYGSILDIWLNAPALDGTQFTLSLEDEDDDEIYTSGLLDESTLHHLTPGISYAGTLTVKITAVTNQLADREFRPKIIYG